MIHFCPSCWKEIPDAPVCPACGADLSLLSQETFDEKLIRALRHREPTVPVRAALILGERGTRNAVGPLIELASSARDPYIQEAAVTALGKIGDTTALDCLKILARQGALRVRHAVRTALECLQGRREPRQVCGKSK